MSRSLEPHELAALVSNVTRPMMGRVFEPSQATSQLIPTRVAFLPLLGGAPRRVVISADDTSLIPLGAALFQIAEPDVDPSIIDDSLGELLNMTAGQIKNLLEPQLLLGLPTVLSGPLAEQEYARVRATRLRSGPIELLVALTSA